MNRRKAQSFFEIIIVLGLIVFTLFPTMLIYESGKKNLAISSDDFVAITAANELVQQLLSIPFEKVPVGQFKMPASDKKTPIFLISDEKDLKRVITIENILGGGKCIFKKIQIEIFWFKSGQKKNLKISALYAND